MIMQKGQDEVLAEEAVEVFILVREQPGNVLAAEPSIDIRSSQGRPALKVLPDLVDAEVLLDDLQSPLFCPESSRFVA